MKNLCWVIATLACFSAGQSYGQTEYVKPIDWSKYTGKMGVRPGDTFGQTLATVLQNESRYELKWVHSDQKIVNNVAGWEGVDCYYPRFDAYNTGMAIWPMAGFAYSTAAILATGAYSPSVAGLSTADAIHRVELAIRGVAFTHKANMPAGDSWGENWESALFAAPAAEAAWYLWDSLSSQTKLAVAKMMVCEADNLMNDSVPYWADKNGNIVYPGDTKAEENAWNGHLLAAAQAMMPNHPNAAAWRLKASEMQVAAYSRQSDLANTTLVDGKPVKDWLNGYNVFDDGLLVNHNKINPDYIVGDARRTSAKSAVSLAGQYIPQSMVFNADLGYRALTELQFTPGTDTKYGTGRPIVAPGGTIYYRTAGGGYPWTVYYPQGSDWSSKVIACYLHTDLNAEHLGLDAGKGFDAMGWAEARVQGLLDLQNRPGHDGNLYQPGDWNAESYRAKDEDTYISNGEAWMQWWLMQNDLMSPVGDHWGPVGQPEG